MEYLDFLESKRKYVNDAGFECAELNNLLKPFQDHCVRKALKKGKFALFEDCGLGKTFQQLVWAEQVVLHTNMPVLILAPLAVTGQTILEGEKFGIVVKEYNNQIEPGIYITNYEQLENINILFIFSGVVLDESSILKNFEGAIRNIIIDGFAKTPFKLACTANPSPNDPMELGNHSEFLNVMPRNEMLAMYFVHDGGETAKWRLKGHCEQVFWDWVSEWAIMMAKPSDIGFDSTGYDLPPLNFIEKQIKTDNRDNGQLFNDVAISATNFNSELRLTKIERLSEVAEIVNSSTENFIVWIKQNEEGEYLRKLIPDAIEVKGNDTHEYKKTKLLGFAKNEFRVLITKTKIAQFGMNYQNCHNQVFASVDFSFEGLYQAIRRSYRFGQEKSVNIWLITTDTMTNVIQSINRKQNQFIKMQQSMTLSINKNMTTKVINERPLKVEKGHNFIYELGDSVQLIKNIPDESIGFSIFSPPFPELYTYSSELEDMGNSRDYKEFMFAFNFLVKDLYRILWSGRNVAVHCMDLPIQKGKEGYIGLRDFSGMLLSAFCGKSESLQNELKYLFELESFICDDFIENEDTGLIEFKRPKWLDIKVSDIEKRIEDCEDFIYHSRVTIWKNPVTEMTRTKALGLLHKQIKKDAAMSRVGIPDYLMVFRKPGEHKHPVINQDTDPNASHYLPVDMWQKIASPVWMDIDYGNTLNLKGARDEKDNKHICPLQLDTIERSIHLWSNVGDTVYSPFAGIGSELFKALLMDRKARGGELKESYFNVGVKNCRNAELSKNQELLFQ